MSLNETTPLRPADSLGGYGLGMTWDSPGHPALPIRTLPKNWPADAIGRSTADLASLHWRLLADFATPICSLSAPALAGNLAAISAWIGDLDVSWAPHGKTTMSPELIRRQLEAGAWGITAATPWQADRLIDWGVRRIVLANICADPGPLAWVLRRDATLVTFVDSIESVRLTAVAQRAAGHGARLPVLIEVGMPGGPLRRTRCGDGTRHRPRDRPRTRPATHRHRRLRGDGDRTRPG